MNTLMVEAMTQLAYGEYCKAVGGTAFNGDPLPEWKQFSSDAKKQKQANAWRASTRAVIERLLQHD